MDAVKAKATQLLNSLTQDDLQHCFQQWKIRRERCRDRGGDYIEGDNISIVWFFFNKGLEHESGFFIATPRKYSYFSWWWTWRGPKHVEVINKIEEMYWEYCAPNWFHLQKKSLVIMHRHFGGSSETSVHFCKTTRCYIQHIFSLVLVAEQFLHLQETKVSCCYVWTQIIKVAHEFIKWLRCYTSKYIPCILYCSLFILINAKTYILIYFISTSTCFSPSAPSSGSLNFVIAKVKCKVKVIPLQARCGPEGG